MEQSRFWLAVDVSIIHQREKKEWKKHPVRDSNDIVLLWIFRYSCAVVSAIILPVVNYIFSIIFVVVVVNGLNLKLIFTAILFFCFTSILGVYKLSTHIRSLTLHRVYRICVWYIYIYINNIKMLNISANPWAIHSSLQVENMHFQIRKSLSAILNIHLLNAHFTFNWSLWFK